jgi:hypothetical protein
MNGDARVRQVPSQAIIAPIIAHHIRAYHHFSYLTLAYSEAKDLHYV